MGEERVVYQFAIENTTHPLKYEVGTHRASIFCKEDHTFASVFPLTEQGWAF